jgi:hypothetical protein
VNPEAWVGGKIGVTRRRPDKSAWRVERPTGSPQGERSELSGNINKLDPGYRIKSGTGPAGVTIYSGVPD